MFCSIAILILFIVKLVALKRKKILEVLLAQGGDGAGARGGPGSFQEQVHHLRWLPGTRVSAQMSPAMPSEQSCSP